MKKVLFVATITGHINSFHLPYLKLFKDNGWETAVLTGDTDSVDKYCDKKYTTSIKRNPFKLDNIIAIREMKTILEKEHFDIIHCHTPMGSVVTRLAAKKARKNGTRVIYTAHGFHFYTGAPLINWLLFYPVEWYLAKYTDTLITINQEDFNRAKKKFSKRCHDIQYVPGVGINPKKFDFKMNKKEKHELRASLGLKDDDFVMIFPARLDKNKNQGFLIKCMPELIKENPKIHLLLPGQDELNGKYQRLAEKLNVENNVHFLGKRDDVPRLLKISDLAVSSSKREGLPVNLLEAVESYLPIIALNCRGCNDILNNTNNKILTSNNRHEMIKAILDHEDNKSKTNNIEAFTTEKTIKVLSEIYFKKKKILHILSSNKFSGAENVACTIINNLSNKYAMTYCSPNGPIEKRLKEQSIDFIDTNNNSISTLKRIIAEHKPQILHAHDYRSSIIAALVGGNAAIISHIHQNSPKVRHINFYSIIYLILSVRYSKIIWVSKSAFDDYAFRRILRKKSIILTNVIDEKQVYEKSVSKKITKSFDLIYLGRLCQQKNPERLINIISETVKLKRDITVAVVGDGEKKEQIQSLIKARKLTSNVKMYGFQQNPYPILRASKILVMTSIYEGTPMAALEAQSLGKPIISTPVDGLSKIVINDYNGFVTNDDAEYSEKIIEYLDKNYEVISINSKKRFNELNDRESYFKNLDSIYEGASK